MTRPWELMPKTRKLVAPEYVSGMDVSKPFFGTIA
jgi:hypothetical protein